MKSHLRLAASPDRRRESLPRAATPLDAELKSLLDRLRSEQRSDTELILIVHADEAIMERMGRNLSAAGYQVAGLSTFQSTRELFSMISPDLVIADVRLGEFNGLHLAAWLRFYRPSVPVIITHYSPEPVIEADASDLGVPFVVNPAENPDLLAQIRASLAVRHPVRPPVGH